MTLNQLTLRGKLIFWVACIVLAGFAITMTVVTAQASKLQQDGALLYTQELANRHASDVRNRLTQAFNTAKTLGDALAELHANGQTDRQAANTMMRGMLGGNPDLLAVWTLWEPNAFDGRDSEFVDLPGHDATGRFVPYWNRGSGTVQMEPLVDYEVPGNGDYYLLAKQTGKAVLLDPYKYDVAGVPTLITTITVPIVSSGKFVGAAGIDIALVDLQRLVNDIQVWGVGRASLISNAGLFVSDRNPDRVAQPMESGDLFDQARAAIKAGQAFQMDTHDATLGQVTQVYAPVQLPGIGTPWSLRAEIPQSKIMESVRQLQWTALALALVSIVLVAGVLALALERLVLRPIGGEPEAAADLAERVAQGELTTQVPLKPGDLHSLMARLSHMQDSLRQVVQRVRQGADSVATASSEISQGNQDLSGRTENQASALEETAASIEQLSGTVMQNDESARQANQLAQEASRVATEGGQVVEQVVHTMRDIHASSNQIAQIISVIDGIAFQTNILALNAAVEAARAGEQGRGFAVVAGEVRSLAQRSAEAAKDIKRLIDASVDRVNSGTALVDQAGESMERVVAAIKNVTDLMGHISTSSSEQSAGVQQVRQAIQQIDQVTQQNAALVEQMAAAASSLKGQASELVETVAVFRLPGR